MTAFGIIDPGMFTTVQDLGRSGYGALGVPASGAADTVSLVVGNRLLGNSDHAAALECTLHGPTVTFDHDVWICLVGASCPHARITGSDCERRLRWCQPTMARAGESIHVGDTGKGSRAWLCVSGGIGGTCVLGSRSTFVAAALGGYEGRALRAGDVVSALNDTLVPRSLPEGIHDWLGSQLFRTAYRVIPSLHTDVFPSGALDRLGAGTYTVHPQSDRVGIRLSGPAIPLPDGVGFLESEPTVAGGVQIPGSGSPIVLGADRPTTGGYPLLACVIEADLPGIAMLGPRDMVRFNVVTLERARRLAAEQRRMLDALLPAHLDGTDS